LNKDTKIQTSLLAHRRDCNVMLLIVYKSTALKCFSANDAFHRQNPAFGGLQLSREHLQDSTVQPGRALFASTLSPCFTYEILTACEYAIVIQLTLISNLVAPFAVNFGLNPAIAKTSDTGPGFALSLPRTQSDASSSRNCLSDSTSRSITEPCSAREKQLPIF